jgi:signal transduction histidine kinase
VAGTATNFNNFAQSGAKQETGNQPEMDRWLEMFALFVHDLEAPLASMKYVLKLLEEGRLDPNNPRHRQLVSSSHIAVSRAEAILYDSIAVAKSGKLGMTAKLQDVNLPALLKDVSSLAIGAAAEHGIAIQLLDTPERLSVVADPLLLSRALDNLIFNAIRHTPEKGVITIRVSELIGTASVQIKDTGAGLGDFDPEELFSKYGQIHLRVQGKHRGVGLGLYFCRLAAEAMKGSVSAGNHPDGGAVFTLHLQKTGGRTS